MYSCCRTSVSSWLQEGMTKPLQCTRNIRTGGFTYLKASRWKTSRYIYKRHFGDVSSSKSMEPLSHKGSLFLATLHPGVGCRQEISTGDRTASLAVCLKKSSQHFLQHKYIFHITTVKKTIRDLKAFGYLFSVFWTCILAIKRH